MKDENKVHEIPKSDSAYKLTRKQSEMPYDLDDGKYLAYLSREVELLYKQLVGYISKRIGSSMAQDILHDAVIVLFIKVKTGRFKNKMAIKPFLYSTIKWLIRAYRLKNSKAPLQINEDELDYLLPVQEDSLVNALEEQELREEIQSHLEKLTQKRDQQLLLQHYWYEKPEAFIESYDITTEHYSRLLYRAKKRFASILPAHNQMKSLAREK